MSIETGTYGLESDYPDFQDAIDNLSWTGDGIDRFFPTKTFHYNIEGYNKPGQNTVFLGSRSDRQDTGEVRCTAGRRVIVAPSDMQTLQVIDVISEPHGNRPGKLRVSDLLEDREGYRAVNQQEHEYSRDMYANLAVPEDGFVKVIDTNHTVADEKAWQVTMMNPRTPQQDSEFYLAWGVHEAVGDVAEVKQ